MGRIKVKKFSYEEVKDFMKSRGYKLISTKYINSKEKLKLECQKGHSFESSLDVIRGGSICKVCAIENRKNKRKLSFEYFKKTFEYKGYSLISKDYKNNLDKLEVVCPNNHVSFITFGNFQRGHGCKKCKDSITHNKQKNSYCKVKQKIEDLGFTLLSTSYVNNSTKLDIKCEKGHIFKASFKAINAGNRCSICKKSKGEEAVLNVLTSKKIKYKREFKFKDCRFKSLLPFDFYLPDYNICIEFDGRQHYEIVDKFGGFESFVDTKIRDTIKNNYCKEKGIILIRIPYWEIENIENFIKNEIN